MCVCFLLLLRFRQGLPRTVLSDLCNWYCSRRPTSSVKAWLLMLYTSATFAMRRGWKWPLKPGRRSCTFGGCTHVDWVVYCRETPFPARLHCHHSEQYNITLFWQQLHHASKKRHPISSSITHTHTHPFNGPLSGTTQVSRYQKDKTNLDFTEARDIEWQWHQLGHMQFCTSLQTDNHASTPPLKFFCRPDALSAAQPTASKH